jgi:uncharacterized protein YciI
LEVGRYLAGLFFDGFANKLYFRTEDFCHALHSLLRRGRRLRGKRAKFRDAHLGQARQAHARGDLLIAGALADPVDGAVLVFRGPSPEAAKAFAEADPYVINGLVKAWRVRKWMTVIGESSPEATSK